jgi:hypothetical protein
MLDGLRSWIFLLALLVGGPYLVFSGASDARAIKRLQANGREAQAVVQSVEWRKKRGSESGFRGHVAFKTESGAVVEADIALTQPLGQAIKDGKAEPVVTVRYLPNDPSIVRLAELPNNTSELRWVGGVMFLVGLGMLGWRWRKRSAGVQPATA